MKTVLICLLLVCAFCVCRAQVADSTTYSNNDTLQLGEIVISARTKIRITGDTVNYTVDSFYKNPQATAEDVLKKLPGVNISPDGKLTIQGKEVSKIFINGKEYEASDLRTITQNLPAEILDKIQIADWYNEEAQASGLKNGSEQKSINLQFKKKYEEGLFGKASAGYGTKERYQTGIFANVMGKDTRVTAIANWNNTGQADIVNDQRGNSSATNAIPGLNIKKQLNLNFSYDPSEKLKLNGTYDVYDRQSELRQSIYRTTYLPGDTQLVLDQASMQNNYNRQHQLNVHSRYKISDKLNMLSTATLAYRTGDNNSRNTDITYQPTRTDIDKDLLAPAFRRESAISSKFRSPSLMLSNMLQKKFSKAGRSFSLSMQLNMNTDDKNGLTNNVNTYYSTFITNTTLFESAEDNKNLSTKVLVQYTEPLSEKSSIILKYTNNYTRGSNDRTVWATANGNTYLDTVQSRNFMNNNMEQPVGLTYQYSTKLVTAGAGIDMQPYNRRSTQATDSKADITQSGINYFPTAFSRFNLSKRANLNLNYNGSIIAPDIRQLQPIPDYTDSLNIYIGNPALRPELNNNIFLSYNYFNPTADKMFWANLRMNWVKDKIINQVDINASRRITRPVNADGIYNLAGMLSYTLPIVPKVLKASIALSGGYAQNVTITNNQLQRISNANYQPSVNLQTISMKWFEGELSYTYRRNTVSAASSSTSNALQVHTVATNGIFTLPHDVRLLYALNYVANTGFEQGINQNFVLLNITADKTFNRPKGLTLRAQCFDLLNNYPNIQRSIGDNYFEDRTVNRLGRYFMFSIIYKFTYF